MKAYVHKVKYYECDRMGITHHSNYIRFMEEARVDLLDQLGYGFEKMEADGVVSPVMHVDCTYRKSTTFQDEISIEVKLAKVTALKFSFAYVGRVGGGGSLHRREHPLPDGAGPSRGTAPALSRTFQN